MRKWALSLGFSEILESLAQVEKTILYMSITFVCSDNIFILDLDSRERMYDANICTS